MVVSKEIDGEVMNNASGQILTTGLYGKGPSAENKIKHLAQLQKELDLRKEERNEARIAYTVDIKKLENSRDSAATAYTESFDYLKRELALDQLKGENPLVALTQYLLISLFVLVDLLPVIFKTFAPFGMYDRILRDDEKFIKSLDDSSRKVYIQKVYDGISQV